jgi:hypothetical protein
MILALLLALTAAPGHFVLLDEIVAVPAAGWRAFGIPLPQRPARIECDFSVQRGGSGVRVALLRREEFDRMSRDQGHRELAATAYQRSGGFTYAAPPGDYVLVVDNRMEGRGPARVRLRVSLAFGAAGAEPRTLSARRRAVVIAVSVLVFAVIALFAGSKLRRALGTRQR